MVFCIDSPSAFPVFFSLFVSLDVRLSFTAENPTGHYFLELSEASDFALAEQILALNRWETRRFGRFGRWRRGRGRFFWPRGERLWAEKTGMKRGNDGEREGKKVVVFVFANLE